MEKRETITEYFTAVETTKEYKGYFCSVGEAVTIVILGSFCGIRNVNQIHQWASNSRVSEFLKEHFGISKIPCYYWLLCLLKIIKRESLNQCFINWVESILPETAAKRTISLDGKTICAKGVATVLFKGVATKINAAPTPVCLRRIAKMATAK